MTGPRAFLLSLSLATLAAFAVVALAPSASADRLTLTDGRTVEGLVRKDGDVYRVISRFGESAIPVADVKLLEAGSSFEAAWRTRAEKLAADDHAGRAALATWLEAEGRPDEARILAEAVVEADPENEAAHKLLGHVRHRGSWMSPDEAKAADGLLRRGDEWFTPEAWAKLDAEAKAKAEASETTRAGRAVSARANDAVRMMLSPDPVVRAQGAKRLDALAVETKSEALKSLVPQVAAYAAAADRMVAAAGAPDASGGSATVLSECRIQLAKLKRPIQSFRTGLASNAAGANVEIQLPEIEVIRVFTTVAVPAAVK